MDHGPVFCKWITKLLLLPTDYMKAYDMVQHDVLFAIAETVGGSGYESWLRTLYVGHARIIVINGVKAPPIKLHSSVPQGCCHACQASLIFIDRCEGLAHCIRSTPSFLCGEPCDAAP